MRPCGVSASFLPAASVQDGGGGRLDSGGSSRQTHTHTQNAIQSESGLCSINKRCSAALGWLAASCPLPLTRVIISVEATFTAPKLKLNLKQGHDVLRCNMTAKREEVNTVKV
jgi:hypothetical protein